MDDRVTITCDPAVRVSDGQAVAREVLERMDRHYRVIVDCQAPSRMTPSFANGVIFTLLEKMPGDMLKSRLDIRNANANVHAALRDAVARYKRGVRFNTSPV